jgi:succinate dehydrogenase/fumarate reductase-like Fe-S protein
MSEMANVYFYGKRYSVPAALTIMAALEYAGYKLVRGCGCRHGFCGACVTIYRIAGQHKLHSGLACTTQVEEGMYIASMPFFPTIKKTYNIEEVKPQDNVMMEYYPEIYSCIGCNACTKACSRSLNVMQYISDAQRGDFAGCANGSFDCVSCGLCSIRCPAGITHSMVGQLSRRIYGKYIQPETEHTKTKAAAVRNGDLDAAMAETMAKSIDEMKTLYNARDIEK